MTSDAKRPYWWLVSIALSNCQLWLRFLSPYSVIRAKWGMAWTKMATILHTAFSHISNTHENLKARLRFHSSLFPRIQLTVELNDSPMPFLQWGFGLSPLKLRYGWVITSRRKLICKGSAVHADALALVSSGSTQCVAIHIKIIHDIVRYRYDKINPQMMKSQRVADLLTSLKHSFNGCNQW